MPQPEPAVTSRHRSSVAPGRHRRSLIYLLFGIPRRTADCLDLLERRRCAGSVTITPVCESWPTELHLRIDYIARCAWDIGDRHLLIDEHCGTNFVVAPQAEARNEIDVADQRLADLIQLLENAGVQVHSVVKSFGADCNA